LRERELDLTRPGVDADHLSKSPAVSLIGES
jgi:hypothetical protein